MMHQRFSLIAVAAAPFIAAGSAHAAIMSIAEFIGDATETFENIGPPASYPGPMAIFNGAGGVDDNFTDPWITPNLSDANNTLFAYDGAFMGLAPTGWINLTFNTPVTQFGGFFGHLSQNVSGGTVAFYDDEGGFVESQPFNLSYNQWTWFGWDSDEPISRIEIHTNVNPGAVLVYDNFQIATVPAPGVLAALGFAGLVARRRRR